LIQGTPEWNSFRAEHDGASEIAAAMGVSRYTSRSELLRMKATGIHKEVDAPTQALFNAGHATEASARLLAEELLCDELSPVTFSYGRMSASCDGLTMDGRTAFEHKLHRADLADAVMRRELPDEYMAQCQQIMLVTGADRVLFVTSDGTDVNWAHMFVESDPAWHKRIVATWDQFHADLATRQHVEILPPVDAAPTMALPALSIQVTGSIALVDNLKLFGEKLESFIAGIDKNPSDDQAFANAEAAVKTLQTAETALEAAKASALAQTASIDEMTRTVALYANQARTTRLMLEKLVKARKEIIRVEIVESGKKAFADHISSLNTRLGKSYMPMIQTDFAGVIKGKKTVSSLRDAVSTELARAKIEANETADRIQINLATLRELGGAHPFLFADAAQLVLKANDDLTALVKTRIAEHHATETKRMEAEREKIRQEEAAKLQREQEAKERATKAETERQERLAAQGRAEAERVRQQAARESGKRPTPTAVAQIGPTRPADTEIVGVLALHYRVHESMVVTWLLEMDMVAVNDELASEFEGQ
jgi:predicted phage-related endonuclease